MQPLTSEAEISSLTTEKRHNGRKPVQRLTQVIIANDFAHVNGGAAQVAVSSAIGLSECGYDVTFFAAVPPVAESLVKAGIRVVLTDQYDIKNDPVRIRAATQGLWNNRSARVLDKLLSQCDPRRTVLHVHGWTKALTSSIVRIAMQRRISVVVTLHDYFLACPNGGFFNFRKQAICHLRALSPACLKENCDRDGYAEKLWRSVRQAVQNQFGFACSPLLNFITISDFSASILEPLLPAGSEIYRIASPSDFEKEIPVDVRQNEQFVSLGRLSKEKGCALLAAAGRELGCAVTFVGDGPSRAEIEQINSRAYITGWQSREQVKARLRGARCLVLSSLWYEAQPMVIAEAAAVGVPAIVADKCAGRDMVENGVTGLWFRSGDKVDLCNRMRQLLDPDLAAQMGQAAYTRHWNNPFTMNKHLMALADCYRNILEKRTSF